MQGLLALGAGPMSDAQLGIHVAPGPPLARECLSHAPYYVLPLVHRLCIANQLCATLHVHTSTIGPMLSHGQRTLLVTLCHYLG